MRKEQKQRDEKLAQALRVSKEGTRELVIFTFAIGVKYVSKHGTFINHRFYISPGMFPKWFPESWGVLKGLGFTTTDLEQKTQKRR